MGRLSEYSHEELVAMGLRRRVNCGAACQRLYGEPPCQQCGALRDDGQPLPEWMTDA